MFGKTNQGKMGKTNHVGSSWLSGYFPKVPRWNRWMILSLHWHFLSQKKWTAAPLELQLHKSTWIGPTWIQPVVWFWAKSEIGCSRLTSGCGLPIELLDLTPNFYITVLFYGIMDQKQHWKSVECDVNSTIYIHLFHHGYHWHLTFWEKSGHTWSSQFVLTQPLNASLPNQPLVPCQHRVICGGFWQKQEPSLLEWLI